MKNVILTLVTVLAFNLGNAQDVDIFTESLIGCKKLQKSAIQIDTSYIIEVPNKSALEIFQMVEVAVASQWVNPDEVISGKVDGKYIKINGGAPQIAMKVLGMPYYYTSTLRYYFKFKDGRFMFEVESFMRIPASKYSSGGTYSTVFSTHNRRGVEDKISTASIERVNSSINSFINSILEADSETVGDDW